MKRKLLTLLASALMMLGVQSANALTLTCLRGSGFGEGEGCQKLFDGDQNTKWGTWDGWYDNPVYAVVKAAMPIVPEGAYSLRIANDTNSDTGRNWKSWRILGGNFASDDEASRSADGWVAIDERNETDILPSANNYSTLLKFSNGVSAAYSFYKVEITASGGGQQQMSEIYLCSEEEFNAIRQPWIDELEEFAAGLDALTVESGAEADKATFATKYNELKTTTDADVLTSLYNELVALKQTIEASIILATGAVSLKEGTEDADKWTAKAGDDTEFTTLPLEDVTEGTTVTMKYSGTRHVKSVKAVVTK